MPAVQPIVAFNAGEFSPLLEGRYDMDKYRMSCRTMENFRPTKYGAAVKRPGTEYIATTKDSSKKSRVIKFQFSTTTTYILEVGDLYIRIYESEAAVTVPTASAWGTTTDYVLGDLVEESSTIYYCIVDHTSGTFATDLAAGKWAALGAPSAVYELTTEYTQTDVDDLQFCQINDVMYLTHPDFAPCKLSRIADYYWTFESFDDVAWTYPALLKENTDEDITITPSGKTLGSSISLLASEGIFRAGHVNSYWEITHRTKGQSEQLDISGSAGTSYSSVILVQGDWQVTTSERWWGTLTLQRSDDGSTGWEDIREWKSKSDRNVSVEGNQAEKKYFRLKYVAAGDPYGDPFQVENNFNNDTPAIDYQYFKAAATLEHPEQFLKGIVQITAVTDSFNATATVIKALADITATDYWAEGAWSTYRGFPRAVAAFEQRLAFGATSHQRQTVWLSQTDDLENFQYGADDSDAMSYTLAAQEHNEIMWLVGQTRLMVGTQGGEFSIGASDTANPLTPTNVLVRRQSTYGSHPLQALGVNDVILFVQRQGRKVRELAYSFEKDGYIAPDLTILSEHITEGGLVAIDYQQQPDAVLWGCRADGTLVGMTYERQENVVGWFRYVSEADASFESVTCVHGTDADEVYFVVKRTINGSTVRYIEKLADQSDETVLEDRIYMDSALSFEGIAAVDADIMTYARPGVFAISAGHPFSNDQQVRITNTGMTRMDKDGNDVDSIDGIICTVKNATGTQFDLYDETGSTPVDLRDNTTKAITGASVVGDFMRFTFTAHWFVVGDYVNVNSTGPGVGGGIPGLNYYGIVMAVTATTVDVDFISSSPNPSFPPDYMYLRNSVRNVGTSVGTAEQVENTFTNLAHLEGEEVVALVDGSLVAAETVSSGAVTLDEWGNKVHIGLAMTATLKPQRLDMQTQRGLSVGKTYNIGDIVLRLYKTLGIKIGSTTSNLKPVHFKMKSDAMDTATPMYTGDKKISPMPGGSTKTGDIIILSSDPLPATINAIFPNVEVTG